MNDDTDPRDQAALIAIALALHQLANHGEEALRHATATLANQYTDLLIRCFGPSGAQSVINSARLITTMNDIERDNQ